MLLPFSVVDLETVLKQARKKIVSHSHVDEAIILLDYLEGMLKVMPFIKGSDAEFRKNTMLSEIAELKGTLNK